jgi:hypothetical protein
MILPEDQETIIAMVGVHAIDLNAPPKAFVDEYLLRLGMMSRAGKQGCLGPAGMMQLLRDQNIAPVEKKAQAAVSDWTRINQGTPILCAGKRGVYYGPAGSGCVLVQFEGQRARVEVPFSTVTIAEPIVDGMDDDAFDREPEPPAAKLTEAKPEVVQEATTESKPEAKPEKKKAKNSAAGVRVDDQPPEPAIDQEVLDMWGLVDSGTAVKLKVGDEWMPAEFVDCQKDNTLSVVLDGKKMVVPAADVLKA